MTQFAVGDRVRSLGGSLPRADKFAGVTGTVTGVLGDIVYVQIDDTPQARLANGRAEIKNPWHFNVKYYPLELLPSGPDLIAEMFS